MIGETANIETYKTPVESNYDKQDAEEYYKNGDIEDDALQFETLGNEKEEAAYSGEKIPATKDFEKLSTAFKKKRIGNSALRFAASFGKTA